MSTLGLCDHKSDSVTQAGQETYQVTGICSKCGVNLDHEYFKRRFEYIEKRLDKLEEGS